MKPVIITICLVLLAPAVCAYGIDRLVPSQYPTIQAAVNAASYNDTVIIAPGTYSGDGNTNVYVSKPITIRSQDGPETCIIECNGSAALYHYGFTLNMGTLAGLTITGGNSLNGGAVICDGSSYNAKITNCILTGNISKQGGAIFCRNSNLEITNCSLTNNSCGTLTSTGFGGAVYCQNGSLFIANCTISGNYASNGGGIYCAQQGNVTIKNCVIRDNLTPSTLISYGYGGGIYCTQGSINIIGSEIGQNSSFIGAGIYCLDAASFIVSDCNIHGNVAEGLSSGPALGGGIYNRVTNSSINRTLFSILKSSITDNVVRGRECKGGGLYLEIYPSTSPPQITGIMLTGCVVARNSALAPAGISYGGGIYTAGRVLLAETEVKDNSAIRGGGIYNQLSGTNISRCRISGNSAMYGSAIECYTDETIIENSVISGNWSLRPFFAECPVIQCGSGTLLKIANCTIVGNVPPLFSSSSNPSSSISNSIIFSNHQNPFEVRKIPPGFISISYSDIEGGYAGIGNIDADPYFAVPGHWDTNGTPIPFDDFWVEGNYRLTAASPCIDSGGIVFLADNKDLAGNPRIIGAAIDMGAYENNNTRPVAEAGPDQNVFAWIDGNAAVTLDGSKSYDPDGDKLSYLWNWAVDGNSYEANGVNPTIKLPVGEHKIELIVNDKLSDSQPDDVNITVVGPVEGQLRLMPAVINRQYGPPNILAMLKLPAGITKDQIDSEHKLLLYPGGIEAKTQYIIQYGDNRIVITAVFDRSALLTSVGTNGNVRLSVVGRLTTGQYFFGQVIVRIFAPPPISYPPAYIK